MSDVTRNDIHQACKAEGLALMGDVFDVILDRGDVTVEEVARWLDQHSVDESYTARIGPAIDSLESAIVIEVRTP